MEDRGSRLGMVVAAEGLGRGEEEAEAGVPPRSNAHF